MVVLVLFVYIRRKSVCGEGRIVFVLGVFFGVSIYFFLGFLSFLGFGLGGVEIFKRRWFCYRGRGWVN